MQHLVVSSTAVLIFTAGVVSTVVVLAVVVAALGVGIEGQLARQQVRYLAVCVAGDTGVELNARFGQGSAGAAADAAADQGVHLMLLKEPSQGAVAAADGADHLGGNHLAVLDIIEFKLFAVAEVLEHLAIFVSYRDFHHATPQTYCTPIFGKSKGQTNSTPRESGFVV